MAFRSSVLNLVPNRTLWLSGTLCVHPESRIAVRIALKSDGLHYWLRWKSDCICQADIIEEETSTLTLRAMLEKLAIKAVKRIQPPENEPETTIGSYSGRCQTVYVAQSVTGLSLPDRNELEESGIQIPLPGFDFFVNCVADPDDWHVLRNGRGKHGG